MANTYTGGGAFNYGFDPGRNDLSPSSPRQQYGFTNTTTNYNSTIMTSSAGQTFQPQMQSPFAQYQINSLEMPQSTIIRENQHELNKNLMGVIMANGTAPQGLSAQQLQQNAYAVNTTQPVPMNNINPVVPNIVSNLMSLHVDEGLLKAQRMVNIVCYTILLVTAPCVIIGFGILLGKIVPPLDLIETGNWWTFFLLFTSCLITMLLTGYAVFLHWCTKGQLGVKIVTTVNCIIILVCFPVFFVAIGAGEVSQKKHGPREITDFGLYIMSVCANYTIWTGNKKYDSIETTINPANWDAEKCAAIGKLQMYIYLMYIWAAFSIVVTFLGSTFGLRYWGRNWQMPRVM